MPKVLIDTNLIISFLVNDDTNKASRVKKFLQEDRNTKILLDTVVAEIIWMLSSYYEQDKHSIIDKIRALIHVKAISCNKTLLESSLAIWENNNVSFIDSYIMALAQLKNLKIYSYDFKFDKINSKIRVEP